MKMPHQVLFGKNESSSEACNCLEKYPRIPHLGRGSPSGPAALELGCELNVQVDPQTKSGVRVDPPLHH